MKLNVDNFLSSNETKSKYIWYIKDNEPLVKKVYNSRYNFPDCQYHNVRWWAYIIVNGELVLLMYIENPKLKYDVQEWSRRRKFFLEVYHELEKGE